VWYVELLKGQVEVAVIFGSSGQGGLCRAKKQLLMRAVCHTLTLPTNSCVRTHCVRFSEPDVGGRRSVKMNPQNACHC
jgi:hypothetical protein